MSICTATSDNKPNNLTKKTMSNNKKKIDKYIKSKKKRALKKKDFNKMKRLMLRQSISDACDIFDTIIRMCAKLGHDDLSEEERLDYLVVMATSSVRAKGNLEDQLKGKTINTTKDIVADRNLRASELVRSEVKEREEQTMTIDKTWRYIDFVEGDRFMNEVTTDENIKDNWDAEQVAEYAINQIYK